jgi:transcriptional regulator with XRE-family HTH domain
MEELGEFLRSRRARLSPQDAGAATYGERRRVPGLRREELALLAGVSAAYYTRLEQGQSRNASDVVLDALARALRLDGDEIMYLHALARPQRRAARPRPRPERIRAGAKAMIAGLGDTPAILMNYRSDILAWTPTGHALLFSQFPFDAPDQADKPNLIRLNFCDPLTRDLYADWPQKAQDSVAYLRLISGSHSDDPRLTSLIGELCVASPEFAKLWTRHTVRMCRSGVRGFRHPYVGHLTLYEEVMELVQDAPAQDAAGQSGSQRLLVFGAEPGSSSEAGLRLLSSVAAERAGRPVVPAHLAVPAQPVQ